MKPIKAIKASEAVHRLHQAERSVAQSDSSPAGFTLLEMVVSFGIFAVVVVIAVGAVLAISNAQVKATNIQDIQDNLRFALESMTKEMRSATAFTPAGGSPPAYASLAFTRSDGERVMYCLLDGAVRKITGPSTNCVDGSAITASAIEVQQLIFYAIGTSAGPADGQPRITVSLRARSTDPKFAASFQLQTTIVPRERDL